MDPALYRAAIEGQVGILRQHRGMLGVQLTANKNTVLHVAAQFHDNVECVEVILNLQPSLLCQVNSKRETALHIAARNGHSNTVRVLIEHSKSLKGLESLRACMCFFLISPVWKSVYTFFFIMIWSGVKISEELMLSISNKHKDTALHEAVRNNHLNVVRMLVRENAVFTHVNNFGETPLYIAAKKDSHSHDIVYTILEDCKSPAHSGPDGTTALHAAVIAGCPGCTKKILEKTPNLMKKVDLEGWTPLHYAAREGHVDVMKELLSYSPDCWEMVNGKGQNILHIAKEHEKEEVINFIRSRRVENSNLEKQIDNDGNTPINLPAASNEGSTSIIEGNRPKKVKEVQDYNTTRDAHLVVAALIATVTFTAGLTLPGGFHSNEGPDQGTALLIRNATFKIFVIANATAMALSVSAISVCIFPLFTRRRPVERRWQLLSGFALVAYAMYAMMIAFISGSYAVLSNSSDLAPGVLIIGSFLPLLILRSVGTKINGVKWEKG